MEHNNIRHKLSEYIDDSVSPDERTAIEEHLKTCGTCSDALYELQKTVEHIKSVEEVEPPAWMTKKIMTTVRSETEEKKGLFQRLFTPLSVKLPLQAVAVLFLAVTAFYLYRNIEPTPVPSEAPVRESAVRSEAPAAPAPRDRRGEPAIVKRAPTPAEKMPQTPQYKALDMKLEYEQPAPPVALGKNAESASAPGPLKSLEPPQVLKGNQTDKISPESRAPARKEKASAPAIGLAAEGKQRTEGAALAAKAQSAFSEGGAGSAVDVKIKVKEFGTARKEIEKAVAASGGKIVGFEPSADKGVISLSIKGEKLAELLSTLKTIGDVDEKVPARSSGEEYLAVRITMTMN